MKFAVGFSFALALALGPRCFAQAFVGQNFTGGLGANIALQPPDTDGAAGINHYVQFINGRFAIYNKGTGALISSQTSFQFWTGAGITFGNDSRSDPRISYDPLSGRWFCCQVDVINGSLASSNNFLLGVSNTSDPTQGFKAFKFSIGSNFGDFPTMGVNAEGVYLSTNNFPLNAGNTTPPTNTTIVSIPKSDLLLATPTIAHKTQYTMESLDARGNVLQPIVNLGASPGHEPFLGMGNGSMTTTLVRTTLNNATALVAGAATLSTSVNITVPVADNPPPGQQPGGGTIDSVDNRLGSVAYQIGNSLWAAQCVSFNGRAAVRWYQIDETTNALLQSGTISDPNFDFVAPSVSANANGDVVIGYTRTSSASFPSAAVSVGTTSSGVTTFAAPQVLLAGTNTFTGSRWGDYSATSPDVADPGIFWTTQEWATSGSNNWATQVTEVIPNKPGEIRWMLPTSGTFATGANWFGGAAPSASSHAIFSRSTLGTGYTVTLAGATTLDRLSVRQGNATLNLNGAALSINNAGATTPSIAVGEFGGNPVLTVTGSGALSSVNTSIAAGSIATGTMVLASGSWNNSGSIFVGGSSSAAGGAGSLIVNSAASLAVGGTLKAWNAGNVKLASPTRVGAVSAVGNGKIDLTNSAMVVDYAPGPSPLASVGALITSGYASSAWTGPGINSSTAALPANFNKTAVGYAEASDVFTSFPATFAGLSVNNSSVLMRYTLYGDANLDLTVDTVDFNLLAASFSQSGKRWFNGDFNFDGSVDTTDFNLLAANFGQALAAEAARPVGALVPEPTNIAVLLIIGVLAKRRRANR